MGRGDPRWLPYGRQLGYGLTGPALTPAAAHRLGPAPLPALEVLYVFALK